MRSPAAATAAWNSEQPNELWIGHRNQANQQLLRDPGLVSEAARAHISYPGGHNEGYDDSFKQSFKSFYDYIAAADFSAPEPFPTFAATRKSAILESRLTRCKNICRNAGHGWVYSDANGNTRGTKRGNRFQKNRRRVNQQGKAK